MIRFEQVTKSFLNKEKVDAVKNVSLEINKGEIFGIIGYSGAGKSTLVRCINMLEKPTKGRIFIDDKEITAMSDKEIHKQRKKIGMIFQQFNLFPSRTIEENVEYPLLNMGMSKKDRKKRVAELLELVELPDKKKAYPSQLSGGQKQRVAIARALASKPDILLSDESTSALDPKTTNSILTLLKKLNKELGITIVMITHEMQVVKKVCDRVAVMMAGEIIEAGDVFEIFANPKKKITKEFVENTSNLAGVYELIEEKSPVTRLKPGEKILRFSYLERNVSEALVSYLTKTFHLTINIIFGNIEIIGENPIGGLVSIVKGETEDMEAAMNYLKEKNVGVEVILDGGAA